MRVLAVVSRFKWTHIDYLLALGREVDLTVAWSDVGHDGAPEHAVREGVRARGIGSISGDGEFAVRRRLGEVVEEVRPHVIHLMYYRHEALTLMTRDIAGTAATIVWECRDPLTTLERAAPGSAAHELEGAALRAADGHIVVSDALREYLERSHDVDLAGALVVPHAFAAHNAGPLREKLSTLDGRTHIALVGTADAEPGHGRYYVDIIRRLVGLGFVVHSHFHEDLESLDRYARLDEELADYHHHPTVVFRNGHSLSDVTSRYDLMGVFHELEAEFHNESATLAVCMPTKAVSAWLHGAIPIVTFRHYGGLVEQIRAKGIGFVANDWHDVGRLVSDWPRIRRASARCAEHRAEFTHEFQAARIAAFYQGLVGRGTRQREHSRAASA